MQFRRIYIADMASRQFAVANNRARNRHVFLASIVAIALLGCIENARAQVEVAVSEQTDSEKLADDVRGAISRSSRAVQDAQVRIAIGAGSLRAELAKNDSRPLIASHITNTDFYRIVEGSEPRTSITAVFSNPDPRDQLALAESLLGRAAIGILVSPTGEARALISTTEKKGIRVIETTPGEGTDAVLRSAYALDAIIVSPDSQFLTRTNVSYVVRSLYQRRAVLIGYSEAMTRAGALASVYVDSKAISQRVAELIERYLSEGSLPEPAFAEDIDVALNIQLSRSLNIALPTRQEIVRRIVEARAAREARP